MSCRLEYNHQRATVPHPIAVQEVNIEVELWVGYWLGIFMYTPIRGIIEKVGCWGKRKMVGIKRHGSAFHLSVHWGYPAASPHPAWACKPQQISVDQLPSPVVSSQCYPCLQWVHTSFNRPNLLLVMHPMRRYSPKCFSFPSHTVDGSLRFRTVSTTTSRTPMPMVNRAPVSSAATGSTDNPPEPSAKGDGVKRPH